MIPGSNDPGVGVVRSIILFLVAVAEIGGRLARVAGRSGASGALHVSKKDRRVGHLGLRRDVPRGPHPRFRPRRVQRDLRRRLAGLGTVFHGFRPDRYDLMGAAICLLGVAVVMYVPRSN